MTGITCEDIGIGTIHTWHGSPDGRVRGGAAFVCKEDEDEDEDADEDKESDDDDSVHSDGRTTAVEAKISIKPSQLPQVVGTCVTTSFTEWNLHLEKSAMVPTVLIGQHSFRACLYDCEKDILIISSRKSLSTKGHLSQSANCGPYLTTGKKCYVDQGTYWFPAPHRNVIIHFTIFFIGTFFLSCLLVYASILQVYIKAKLEEYGALPHYVQLTRKDINWDVARTEFVLEGDELPVSYLPAPKRRKKEIRISRCTCAYVETICYLYHADHTSSVTG